MTIKYIHHPPITVTLKRSEFLAIETALKFARYYNLGETKPPKQKVDPNLNSMFYELKERFEQIWRQENNIKPDPYIELFHQTFPNH